MASTAVKEEQMKGIGAAAEKDLAEKIEQISGRIPTARQRIAELMTEREKLVIPARVDRDTAAQKRIRAIDDELLALQHDLADDQAAANDLSGQLESVKNARILDEWEQRRHELRKLLVVRREGKLVGEILHLANSFDEALRKLKEDDRTLCDALTKLAPQWRSTWTNLAKAPIPFTNFVAWNLAEVLPIDTRGMRSDSMRRYQAREYDRLAIDRVLAQLDDLELGV